MWSNPFPRIESSKDSVETMSFRAAQAFVNFVILEPIVLPFGTERSEPTVRKPANVCQSFALGNSLISWYTKSGHSKEPPLVWRLLDIFG